MLSNYCTTYHCAICNSKPDQMSHHKMHIGTQKHQDKKELFRLRCYQTSGEDLLEEYGLTDVDEIVERLETVVEEHKENSVKSSKKLNNLLTETIDSNLTSEEMSEIIENSYCASNKEALKNKIHEIHNFLRNNGAGYGMNALKVFNVIYGLKRIEENNLIDKVGLKRPECEFSYLLGLAESGDAESLNETILNKTLASIYRSGIKDFLFYLLPSNFRSNVWIHLVKEINKITKLEKSCNVLLSGKIYEYFIGRDATAISELGAYFTDSHIVEYIFCKLDAKLNDDNSVPDMIDMFGGSGGFTTGYISYLNSKYPKQIDWETQINNVYHYDVNQDVIKYAGLEFFCLTGVIPNMGNQSVNLKYKNSFCDSFEKDSFRYIITNPPYGGDNEKKSPDQIKKDKLKKFIKSEIEKESDSERKIRLLKQIDTIQKEEKSVESEKNKYSVCLKNSNEKIVEYARKYGLDGNDKESISLILLMQKLAPNGTCIGVLKEGVFFDKKYSTLRKHLVENFNVREIISVPQDQFENTSTKTSIIIFDNTEEKTTNVVFKKLVVEKIEEDIFEEINGWIVLKENKDDIKNVFEEDVSFATFDEIKESITFTLDSKNYNKKKIVIGEDYQLLNCQSLFDYLPKSKRNASFGSKIGEYPFYSSSEKIKKCNTADYDKECLLLGTGGNSCLHYVNEKFSCSADILAINSKNNVPTKFFYYSFQTMWKSLINNMSGSTIKHLTKETLNKFSLPIPKSIEKIQYWVNRISKPYDEKVEKQKLVEEMEKEIKEQIQSIIDNEDCEEIELSNLTEFIKTGKNKTPDNKTGKLYPYYGTSEITGFTDFYLFDGNFVLIARNGTIGNCFLVEGKFFPSDHIFVVKNNDKVSIEFIYYSLINKKNDLENISNGSIIKGISKENLSMIKLQIPKNENLKNKLQMLFYEVGQLKKNIENADKLYKQYIQELADEAIPPQSNLSVKPESNINSFISEKSNEEEQCALNSNVCETNIEIDGIKMLKPVLKSRRTKKVV